MTDSCDSGLSENDSESETSFGMTSNNIFKELDFADEKSCHSFLTTSSLL